jgi:pimeloyl-ACP methyl ester carboxylesterase
MVLVLFTTVIVLYIGLIVYMARYQHRLVFHPSTRDIFIQTTTPFDIVTTTTDDGLTLKGFYSPPQPGKPVIVYFHGNAGDASNRIFKTPSFIAAGYGFLLTEYRGYGGNPGRPAELDLYRDGRAWLQFLQTHGLKPDHCVYYGESLGTGVAVQLATETPPKALILEAPFTSVTDIGAFYYPYLPVRRLAKHRFDSFSKVQALTMPVMIYHGTRDVTVPYQFGKKLYDAIPSQHKVFTTIPDAQHHDLYQFAIDTKILEFLHDYAP